MREIKEGIYRVIITQEDCGKYPCVECDCGCGCPLWVKSPAIYVKKKNKKYSLGCSVRMKILTRGDILGKEEEPQVLTKEEFLNGASMVSEPKVESKSLDDWLTGNY